jgi:ABC-type uncharacterized transport system YnjBCD substrate-binding protein
VDELKDLPPASTAGEIYLRRILIELVKLNASQPQPEKPAKKGEVKVKEPLQNPSKV